MNSALDIKFIKRVYRTSGAVWLFVLLICAVLKSAQTALGVTIGFGISIGSLMLLEKLVTALFIPEATSESHRAVRKLLIFAIIKYAIIAVILWAALKSLWASPAGLAIGIGLPYVVIFLKALGIYLSPKAESDRRL
jgi:FtsH-binding integral membrane protein